MKQLRLFKEKTELSFGGSKLKGRRKTARPLCSKRPIHLVLKAGNAYLLARQTKLIVETVKSFSKRFGIVTYDVAVEVDHVHLIIKIPNRELYRKWIRALTSVLKVKIPELKWRLPPFTRVSAWGRAFKMLQNYLLKNRTEAEFILSAHLYVEDWRDRLLASARVSPVGRAPVN